MIFHGRCTFNVLIILTKKKKHIHMKSYHKQNQSHQAEERIARKSIKRKLECYDYMPFNFANLTPKIHPLHPKRKLLTILSNSNALFSLLLFHHLTTVAASQSRFPRPYSSLRPQLNFNKFPALLESHPYNSTSID